MTAPTTFCLIGRHEFRGTCPNLAQSSLKFADELGALLTCTFGLVDGCGTVDRVLTSKPSHP
jgi:hypothetical protein